MSRALTRDFDTELFGVQLRKGASASYDFSNGDGKGKVDFQVCWISLIQSILPPSFTRIHTCQKVPNGSRILRDYSTEILEPHPHQHMIWCLGKPLGAVFVHTGE